MHAVELVDKIVPELYAQEVQIEFVQEMQFVP
jgi:hypothetical protein